MEVKAVKFLPNKYYVIVDSKTIGSFMLTHNVWEFRQLPTIYVLSADTLIEVGKYLKAFKPEQESERDTHGDDIFGQY